MLSPLSLSLSTARLVARDTGVAQVEIARGRSGDHAGARLRSKWFENKRGRGMPSGLNRSERVQDREK